MRTGVRSLYDDFARYVVSRQLLLIPQLHESATYRLILRLHLRYICSAYPYSLRFTVNLSRQWDVGISGHRRSS